MQHVRDFEHCSIVKSAGVGTITGERGWLDEPRHGSIDGFEIFQHQANFFLEDPYGVVALLRKRPGIAFDDRPEVASLALRSRFPGRACQ